MSINLFNSEFFERKKHRFFSIKCSVGTRSYTNPAAFIICQLDDLVIAEVGYVEKLTAKMLDFTSHDFSMLRSEVQPHFIVVLCGPAVFDIAIGGIKAFYCGGSDDFVSFSKKIRHIGIGRVFIEVLRSIDLLQIPFVQNGYSIRRGECVTGIMRDKNSGYVSFFD